MPSKKASEGLIPEAHPTAPGGMSQQALVNELIDKHGWTMKDVECWRKSPRSKAWNTLSWNEMIDAVCQERLAREAEDADERIENALIAEQDDLFNEQAEDDLDDLLDSLGDDPGDDPGESEDQADVTGDPLPLFLGMPDSYDYIFDGHAGASPSGAERWMNCTASLRATREFLETLTPEQQVAFAGGSSAARQGTAAHAAAEAELSLRLGHSTVEEYEHTILELTLNSDEVDEAYDTDMAEHVRLYTDLIEQYIGERGTENVLIETRVAAAVPLTHPLALGDQNVYEIKGSGDAIALPTDEHPSLVIVDYKHGEGIDVDVEANPQTRIYALGALALLVDEDGMLTRVVDEVVYHIVQPRTTGIKTWSESLDDLLDWLEQVLAPALTAALTGYGAEFNPSDETCQWCPAKGGCAALAEQRVAAGAELFDVLLDAEFVGEEISAGAMSDEKLGELLTQISGLISLHDEMKAEAQRRLLRGAMVPGFKLVNYSPPRYWDSDAKDLIPSTYPVWSEPKLLTPKQALELTKGDEDQRKLVESLIETPDKKPVIGTTDDRRSEWVDPMADPAAMFPEMED